MPQKKSLFDQMKDVSKGLNLRQPEKKQTPAKRERSKNPGSPNLGWVFYRQYFKKINWRNYKTQSNKDWIEEQNSILTQQPLKNYSNEISKYLRLDFLDHQSDTFALTTTYPGLLIGSGYAHETGELDGEFKLGFFFDHTTGLPVLPGSTVKGILRSAFEKEGFLQWIWQALEADNKPTVQSDDWEKLKSEIFENTSGDKKNACKNWDVFYHAYPEKSIHPAIQNKMAGIFLANDFITPHKNRAGKNQLDPFANPVPLQFLKVLPAVTFRFQFDVKDSLAIPGFLKKHKMALFQSILQTIGAGAKTNVGYGQFS